jgi:hypothetical protein
LVDGGEDTPVNTLARSMSLGRGIVPEVVGPSSSQHTLEASARDGPILSGQRCILSTLYEQGERKLKHANP